MDRDNRWERVSRAYDLLVSAQAPRFPDPLAVVADAYAHDKSDEFIDPAVVGDYQGMKDGDGVLCFNFRADRVRELLGAMLDPAFTGFERKKVVHFAAAAGLTQYSSELDRFMSTLFAPQSLDNVLGKVVADAGRTQLRMAETEKYPHVTYFLNGGEERPYPGEDRTMVPSPKVATYDLQPEMSAPELTQKAVDAIDSGKYDMIVLNFANPDMVGHTGVLPAAIKAVETVDAGLGRTLEALAAAASAAARGAPALLFGTPLADAGLTWDTPGFPAVPLPGGAAGAPVDASSVGAFVVAVVDATVGAGVSRQVTAFRDGFSKAAPLSALAPFDDAETDALLCGEITEWNEQLSRWVERLAPAAPRDRPTPA
jgi:hypothetical protein